MTWTYDAIFGKQINAELDRIDYFCRTITNGFRLLQGTRNKTNAIMNCRKIIMLKVDKLKRISSVRKQS